MTPDDLRSHTVTTPALRRLRRPALVLLISITALISIAASGNGSADGVLQTSDATDSPSTAPYWVSAECTRTPTQAEIRDDPAAVHLLEGVDITPGGKIPPCLRSQLTGISSSLRATPGAGAGSDAHSLERAHPELVWVLVRPPARLVPAPE